MGRCFFSSKKLGVLLGHSLLLFLILGSGAFNWAKKEENSLMMIWADSYCGANWLGNSLHHSSLASMCHIQQVGALLDSRSIVHNPARFIGTKQEISHCRYTGTASPTFMHMSPLNSTYFIAEADGAPMCERDRYRSIQSFMNCAYDAQVRLVVSLRRENLLAHMLVEFEHLVKHLSDDDRYFRGEELFVGKDVQEYIRRKYVETELGLLQARELGIPIIEFEFHELATDLCRVRSAVAAKMHEVGMIATEQLHGSATLKCNSSAAVDDGSSIGGFGVGNHHTRRNRDAPGDGRGEGEGEGEVEVPDGLSSSVQSGRKLLIRSETNNINNKHKNLDDHNKNNNNNATDVTEKESNDSLNQWGRKEYHYQRGRRRKRRLQTQRAEDPSSAASPNSKHAHEQKNHAHPHVQGMGAGNVRASVIHSKSLLEVVGKEAAVYIADQLLDTPFEWMLDINMRWRPSDIIDWCQPLQNCIPASTGTKPKIFLH